MTRKILILFVLLALLVGGAAAAPPLPCAFYGSVTIGGSPAPVGTVIIAKVFGTDHGQITTTQTGVYGGPAGFDKKLQVVLTEQEYSNYCQPCGDSLLIEFFVNGKKADQTWTFEPGGLKQLHLTVSGVGPSPTATTFPVTTTPTVSPTTTQTTPPTPTPTTTPSGCGDTIPSLPHSFYGTVAIGTGIPAPAGTTIEARGTGVLPGSRNPVTTSSIGVYGGTAATAQRLEVQGCLEAGTPLEFYVGGARAEVYDVAGGTGWAWTYPFSPGNTTELNLRTTIVAPVAEFTANPDAGYAILTVKFTDFSTGPPETWLWNFGDGKTSTERHPTHQFYAGNYNVSLTVSNVVGSSTAYKNITVYRQGSPGGGGGGGGGGGYYAIPTATTPTPTSTVTVTPTPTPTSGWLPPGGTLPLNSALALSRSVMIASGDDTGVVSMMAGVRPTAANGEPLTTLTVRRLPADSVPPVPSGAPFVFAGYAYAIEPSGATFEPHITLSITLTEADFAALQGRELFIKWYNPATSAWEDLPTTVDQAARTVSAPITHTSIFALFASLPPTAPPTEIPTTTVPGPGIFSNMFLWIIVIAVIVIVAIVAIFFLMKQREEEEEEPEEKDWKLE